MCKLFTQVKQVHIKTVNWLHISSTSAHYMKKVQTTYTQVEHVQDADTQTHSRPENVEDIIYSNQINNRKII